MDNKPRIQGTLLRHPLFFGHSEWVRCSVKPIFRFLSSLAFAGPVVIAASAVAQEWVMACAEGSRPCVIDGTRLVQFGANGAFYFGVATNRVVCSVDTFGDPAPGVRKACWYKQSAREQSLSALVTERDAQVQDLQAQADSLEREVRDLEADLNNMTGRLAQLQRQMRPTPPPARRPPTPERSRNKKK